MNHSTSSGANTAFRTERSAMTTSKALFFAAAGISFALSIWLWFSGDRERGLFVGLWVPQGAALCRQWFRKPQACRATARTAVRVGWSLSAGSCSV